LEILGAERGLDEVVGWVGRMQFDDEWGESGDEGSWMKDEYGNDESDEEKAKS
jgi:hypothetical protein